MQLTYLFGFLALPLVTCLPGTTGNQQPSSQIRPRKIWASLAQFDFKPYVLSNTCFDCDRPDTDSIFSCAIKFDWFDPNSARENNVTSCKCLYTWNWDGVTTQQGANNTFDPEAFWLCYSSPTNMFQMRLNYFSGPENFTLYMGHEYKDSKLLGGFPYIYPHTFAESQINLTQVIKKELSMKYFLAGPILANITGLSG